MTSSDLDIAIIGMSGQFPQAKNLEDFWKNLVDGKESLRRLTTAELLEAGVEENEFNQQNYVPVVGALHDIDYFAAEFFGYSPREASLIDPQQRKLLEHAWHALEDAAIDPNRTDYNIGVFVGSSLNTYLLNNILSHPEATQADDIQQILFGNGQDYLATRIAYLLNLRGPAINMQTACSTSLVAVHEACQHLLSQQIDVALAGGVSIAVPQLKGYLYSIDGMLSPDGHCKSFADAAAGTVFSNGVGIIVLKRLVDALADGDAIYAVIKGSAVNNDGHQKVGYTAPSVDGQAEVIALALGTADVQPEQISYLEAHGTGTQLGDPIEITALQKVFSSATQSKQFCALGSLKSNIGHLDTAAGIAGLIKIVLALQHQQIPPSLHCEQPSKKINWQDSSFYINTKLQPWPQREGQARYAGVSSFGIGGTNAHVVLAEAPYNAISKICHSPALLIFSAKTPTALQAMLNQFCEYCQTHYDLDIHSIAKTLQQGRVEFNYRMILVVDSMDDAIRQITDQTYEIVQCHHQLQLIKPKAIEQYDCQSLQLLGQQWLAGHTIDWHEHYQRYKPVKVHLPVYPFERQYYWIEPYRAEKNNNKKINIADWFYLPSWRQSVLPNMAVSSKEVTLLVFTDKSAFNLELVNYLHKEIRVIEVITSERFTKIDEHLFSINIDNKQDYVELLQNLKNQQSLPTHILHTWSLSQNFQSTNVTAFQQHQSFGLLSLIYFIQGWEVVTQSQALQVTVLTNHLNQIANENKIEPHKAPILAAVKVIPKEYLTIQTQLIEIDALTESQFSKFQIAQILAEIAKENYDQEEIVYRGQQRWLRCYTPVRIPAPLHKPFSNGAKKVILIAGGLGQLGLDIADYFSQYNTVSIAILARTKIPHQDQWQKLIAEYGEEHPIGMMLQRILTMRKRGASVNVFSADVSDRKSLQIALAEIENTMGLVNGVIHAAGETVNGIISMKTKDSLLESYQAKVFGTYYLYELFENKNLDFMILCSSMNAIIGGLGQLDNTAANAFIDYFSDYQTMRTGLNILAISWGAVNINRPIKVNVIHQFVDLSTEHKKNRMTDDEVNEVYTRILMNRLGSRIVISTIDFNAVLENWNRVASLAELGKEREAYQQMRREIPVNELPQTELEQFVADLWQQLLGVNNISLQDNFFELGGHSLSAVQFMTKIQKHLHLKIHVMTLYELPTLREISQYLNKQLQQKQAKEVLIVAKKHYLV